MWLVIHEASIITSGESPLRRASFKDSISSPGSVCFLRYWSRHRYRWIFDSSLWYLYETMLIHNQVIVQNLPTSLYIHQSIYPPNAFLYHSTYLLTYHITLHTHPPSSHPPLTTTLHPHRHQNPNPHPYHPSPSPSTSPASSLRPSRKPRPRIRTPIPSQSTTRRRKPLRHAPHHNRSA